MKIFNKNLFVSVITTACLSVTAQAQSLKTDQGTIQIELLKQALSKRLDAPVTSAYLRWKLDPIALLSDALNAMNYDQFVVFFTINNQHKVKCDFTLITDEGTAMVNDCSCDTAAVYVPGFIPYKELGISRPVFGK